MHSKISRPSSPKLSICITTFNRGAVIGATLESILVQMTDDCEVVVLDGGSTDDTERLVLEYASRFDRLRYVRQEKNHGFDRDVDRVVELARGEYCWLTSDDDLLKPGAVPAVLGALRRALSLIVLNVEFRDFTMSKVVQPRWLDFSSDRVYGPDELDRLFADLGYRMLYVGGLVIKRAIWLERNRERYYGSWFIFVGMIFQARLPGEALVMAEPLISFRMSNTHAWSQHLMEIVWILWPALLSTFPVSEATKRKVCRAEPWRSPMELLVYRGMGCYTLADYRKCIRPRLRSIRESLIPVLIALLPGMLANAFLVFYFSRTRRTFHGWRQPGLMLHDLRDSRFHFRNWRMAK